MDGPTNPFDQFDTQTQVQAAATPATPSVQDAQAAPTLANPFDHFDEGPSNAAPQDAPQPTAAQPEAQPAPSAQDLAATNDEMRRMFHAGKSTQEITAYGVHHGVQPNPDQIEHARANGMDVQFVQPENKPAPTHTDIKSAIGDGIIDSLDTFFPGVANLIRGNPGAGKAFTEHAANAAGGDYGPEIGGFLDTATSPSQWGHFGSNLDKNVAAERTQIDTDSQGHPVASVAGELTGAGLTAPLAGAALKGVKIVDAVAQAAPKLTAVAKAVAGGAIYGSGAAGPGNRGVGAAVGAATAPLVEGAVKLPLAAANYLRGSVLQSSPGVARRIISKAISADMNTPESVGTAIGEAHANGVPMALGDTGENVRGLLAASTRASGIGRTIARDALEERQSGLADRVTSAIERDLGPVTNPHQIADDLMTKARDTAAPLYDAAYAKPGAQTFGEKVAPLLQRPSMKRAIANASRIAAEEGRDPTTLGFDVNSSGETALTRVPSWQTMDYVKRGLDDVLEGYRDSTTGKLNLDTEGRAINNTRNSFLQSFDKANPTYADARQAWGGPVSGVTAMNLGRDALNMTADDLQARIRDLTPFEKTMFAAGARRAMAETVQSKGDTADVVNALVGTGKKRAMLGTLFGNRQQFQRFVDTLGQEREGFRTFKQGLLGSPTAANQMDDSHLEAASMAADFAMGHLAPITAASKAVKFFQGKLGKNAQEDIAALLSNTDPSTIGKLAAQLRDEVARRGLVTKRINGPINVLGKGAAAGAGAVTQQAQ